MKKEPVVMQVIMARLFTALAAMNVAAAMVGFLIIRKAMIRSLAILEGRIKQLDIEELSIDRLRVREQIETSSVESLAS